MFFIYFKAQQVLHIPTAGTSGKPYTSHTAYARVFHKFHKEHYFLKQLYIMILGHADGLFSVGHELTSCSDFDEYSRNNSHSLKNFSVRTMNVGTARTQHQNFQTSYSLRAFFSFNSFQEIPLTF